MPAAHRPAADAHPHHRRHRPADARPRNPVRAPRSRPRGLWLEFCQCAAARAISPRPRRGSARTSASSPVRLPTFSRSGEGFAIAAERPEPVSARLLVGADGKSSPVRDFAGIRARERPFAEAALVCDLDLARPLGGTSVEFHYENGPVHAGAGRRQPRQPGLDRRREVLERGAATASFAADSRRASRSACSATIAVAGPGAHLPALDAERRRPPATMAWCWSAKRRTPFRRSARRGSISGCAMSPTSSPPATPTDRAAPDWAGRVSRAYAEQRAADLMRTGAVVEALFRSLLTDFLPAQAARAGGLWALKLVPGLERAALQARHGRSADTECKGAPEAPHRSEMPFEPRLIAGRRTGRRRRGRSAGAAAAVLLAANLFGAILHSLARACRSQSGPVGPAGRARRKSAARRHRPR